MLVGTSPVEPRVISGRPTITCELHYSKILFWRSRFSLDTKGLLTFSRRQRWIDIVSLRRPSAFLALLFLAVFCIGTADAKGICTRSPQVQSALLDKLGGISDCALVTHAHLTNIYRLDLAHQKMSVLKDGDLKGLKNLVELDLRHNKLEIIPKGIFSDMENLNTISWEIIKSPMW